MSRLSSTESTLTHLNSTTIFNEWNPFRVYQNSGTVITGSDRNMTFAEVLGDIYIRSEANDFNDTLPTASSILVGLGTMKGAVAAIGDSFELLIVRPTGSLSDDMVFVSNTGISIFGRNRFKGGCASQVQFIVTGVSPAAISVYTLHNNL